MDTYTARYISMKYERQAFSPTDEFVELAEAQAEIDAYKQDLERTIAEKVEMQDEIDALKKEIEVLRKHQARLRSWLHEEDEGE